MVFVNFLGDRVSTPVRYLNSNFVTSKTNPDARMFIALNLTYFYVV